MSRARTSDPTPVEAQTVTLGEVGLGSIVIFRAADGQDRAAIVSALKPESVNAVVFGISHDDSEAGLKCGLARKGDYWTVSA